MITVNVEPGFLDVLAAVGGAVGALGTVAAASAAVWVTSRDSRDRRRRQASAVSTWIHWPEPRKPGEAAPTPHQPRVVIANGSAGAIYEAVVTWGAVQGAAASYNAPPGESPVCIAKVPPGQWIVDGPHYDGGGMHLVIDAAISFKDGAGHSWRRDAPGDLVPTRATPLVDLDVFQPVTFSGLEPFTRA